jgi:hypothetical protein
MIIEAMDHDIQQRRAALTDAIDMVRRATAAVAAAAVGEGDEMRFAVLEGVQQRLCSVLRELKALA